jgi:hypothetical protein
MEFWIALLSFGIPEMFGIFLSEGPPLGSYLQSPGSPTSTFERLGMATK